jgi:hypothetical protein
MNAVPISGPIGFLQQVLQYGVAIVFGRARVAFLRIAAFLVAGGLFFFVFLHLYLSQLSLYLDHPADEIGSRVLGIAAVSVLVMLFWHSMVVSSIVESVLGRKISGQSFLGIKKWQWRLYAANLKLVLIAGIYLCLFWTGYSLINKIDLINFAKVFFGVVFMVPLVWFLIRSWFFLLSVCQEANEDEILLKSFKASAGYFWSAAAILVSIALITVALQEGAEFFLRLFHLIGPLKTGGTIAENLRLLRTYLGPIVILMAGGYFFTILLTTVVRIRAYNGIGLGRSSPSLVNSRHVVSSIAHDR